MKPKKKKKNSTLPKRTTLKRPRRLQSAKTWISAYTGKNIIRGYARHFRVDLLCAIKELRLLGLTISESYEASVSKTLNAIAARKAHLRHQTDTEKNQNGSQSDENFAYIVGYTSGGAPYGTRWEDMPPEDED